MSATLIALALFGCSDDGSACQRLPAPVQTYESRAECTARLDDALATEAALKAEAPTVFAQCLSGRQLASLGKGTVDLRRVNGVQFAAR
ncbi:MAG: hypothetical protein K0R64_2170 [Novosphingobium lindaniclasticum]|jgi:hypothetical protein|uniref:hypothetical protein n=1 Tax=Novosphingobium lindaniclasticum TaxID=1329895 RepID=UPI00240961C4|nr:hypothetical protein [Novosphingobium lindaniclasticum]MDF2639186.1 hypothetical protein [Novosphingobium lindaniclasticum]